jgi:flagellin
MSLSIQTNTDSLVAQENLLTNSIFQSKTIGQLTSGYRINSAGNDPSGLAIANQYAAAIAELTQGYANGNDATAQLQIMDGGMSNISQLVNTLQTLATTSASGSFTGNRTTLNNQFQTDLGEINRQAESIGLNTGGTFAKMMSVYYGAGTGAQNASNGIVNVDLTNATVDTQSLGLAGVRAVTLGATVATDYNLGAASTTSVNAIASIAANTASLTNGDTLFTFTGPGFGDASGVQIKVNMTGVDDTNSLVTAVNAAIQSAGNTAGPSNGAFKTAGITASINTDSLGKEQLSFTSANTAFQVTANDLMSNALMGNLAVAGAPTGAAALSVGSTLDSGGAYTLGKVVAGVNTQNDFAFTALTTETNQTVTISANDTTGAAHTLTVTLNNTTSGDTLADALKTINGALQSSDDATLQQITAVQNPSATNPTVNFVSTLPNFQVSLGSTATGLQGLGTDGTLTVEGSTFTAMQVGAGGTNDIGTIAGAQAAITAITAAVSSLGTAQAAVGTGEDQLGFASSLAQSQITNFSSAESQIRDANVAHQAANLSKAMVLQQSSIAAMAQANAEPQALLTLLKGL